MFKFVVRGLAAASLALLPLTLPAHAHAAESLPLAEAVSRLPVDAESRDGYDRSAFRHWNTGDIPDDGCNTRAEVLLAETVEPPVVGPGCRRPEGMDIDHMVPLAESWDSGASAWTAQRREAYANDQGAEANLMAVTAGSNRSKADQDPVEWLPPAAEVHCRYVAEWVATKLRWNLEVDEAELVALREVTAGCHAQTVTYEPAP
ncbi:HNH endonuclease family protein [Streptomyces sp. NPDC052092]|uniref:HNH endonuclease family protein n=1 Tax=Streptomyces sp. NPDC052092 TaxID=3365685 RepID=UPI0037D3C464